MKFTAAGDAIIQKRIAEDFPGYDELIPFIAQGDARFFNLETTLNHVGEAWGGQFSGGTYIRMDPEVLEDLMGFGFNMTTANNNHAMDFSYEGLELTLEALESSGLVHSGLGRNLAEASAPRYLETKNGRVALIAVNTSFNPTCMAGEQSSRFPGRPGINGLRIESHLELPQEDLAIIQRIATQTNINAEKEITRKEGYFAELATDEAELGELKFKLGDVPRFVQALNEADMRRIQRAIYEAKLQADYIMISSTPISSVGMPRKTPPISCRSLPTGASIWVPTPLWVTALTCCVPLRSTRTAPSSILWAISFSSYIKSKPLRRISSPSTVCTTMTPFMTC